MPFTYVQIQNFMLSLLLGSVSLLSTALAADNTYPTRPIRLIVQFSPGGNVDTTARTIAHQLSEQLGQQVVIDNRPGANGAIGLELLAGAPPDGYTLGIGFIGNFAINPHLLAKTRFDPRKDFATISRVADAPNILAVHPSVPARSVADLVAYAGKNPGRLAYGSGGVGTVNHLAAELFSRRAGISLLHVPYKGSGQAITDLIGGNIQLMFGGPPSIAPHARTGKLRSLAITTPKKSAAFPDLPTIAESGYPGFQAAAWIGIIGPRGIARPIVDRLNMEIRKALQADAVKKPLQAIGFELVPSTPAEFAEFIRAEYDSWGKIILDQKIRL